MLISAFLNVFHSNHSQPTSRPPAHRATFDAHLVRVRVPFVLADEQVELDGRHETGTSSSCLPMPDLVRTVSSRADTTMPIVCMTGRTSGHAMDLVGRSTAIRSVDDLPLRSARVVMVERVRVRLVPHLVLGLVS